MSSLDQQLLALEDLEIATLRQRWREFYPGQAPGLMSRELLRLAIGYKLQEQVFGGLGRRTQLGLAAFKSESKKGRTSVTPVPKSGTKFIRQWQGTVHEVLTLENGQLAYRGKTYKSLTLIAKLITGTHQSGPRFFGLRKPSDARAPDHG
ncbi:MAG: DUF2924 domain-containing protein [Rhodospirillaceae bacterium]|nr:DUF2924 domain-containing protein [Rhodospirillaceae bacterium]